MNQFFVIIVLIPAYMVHCIFLAFSGAKPRDLRDLKERFSKQWRLSMLELWGDVGAWKCWILGAGIK
jgi:hypothetical protein